MKIKLLLTFDHELPLGKLLTSYQEAMFAPTNQILELASKKNVPVTLFTDVLCAERFNEWDYKGFYLPYSSQLQATVRNGHDVQLHIHPHWLTSKYQKGIIYPSNDYKLSDFSNHPIYSIPKIVSTGITRLMEICTQADQNYKVTAYRAGGFNIEPSSNIIFETLINNGIQYDSSIARSYYFASGLSLIDYRTLPDLPNWYIGKNGNFRIPAKEGILEIPVATIPKTPFEIPTRFKLKKFRFRAPKNHGTMLHEGKPALLNQRVKMLFSSRMLTFDNHTLTPEYLLKILSYNENRFKNNESIILTTCSHPKTMGKHSFYLMETFIDMARDKFPDIEFTSFSKLNS